MEGLSFEEGKLLLFPWQVRKQEGSYHGLAGWSHTTDQSLCHSYLETSCSRTHFETSMARPLVEWNSFPISDITNCNNIDVLTNPFSYGSKYQSPISGYHLVLFWFLAKVNVSVGLLYSFGISDGKSISFLSPASRSYFCFLTHGCFLRL